MLKSYYYYNNNCRNIAILFLCIDKNQDVIPSQRVSINIYKYTVASLKNRILCRKFTLFNMRS